MIVGRREVLRSAIALGATALVGEAAEAATPRDAPDAAGDTAPEAGAAPVLVALEDYERAARERMDPLAWEYVASGAADEITLRWNAEAYRAIRLVPRQLRDVRTTDLGVRVLGHTLPHPIMLAPTACHRLSHPEGELATARGARAAGAAMVLSSYSTTPVEKVAAERPSPFWFQLYVQERAYTEALVRRAVAAGASAIVVTIDTPVSGPRNRQQRSGFTFPTDLPHISGNRAEHPLTWKDLEWIASLARVPILLKGILHPDDVELAVRAGAAGLVVSNHGARNLDTSLATIDALPAVVERVAGRMPVLVDGGIRRGTDVLKALAYGATAVLIGRPYIHGLAVGGAAGVEVVVGILREELAMAMTLCGCASVKEIDRSILRGPTQLL
jgi:4-hydroxymandelate oxidase